MTEDHTGEQFDPNRLFDTLRQMLELEGDEALSQMLHIEPYFLRRIRQGQSPLDPSLLIRINEATGINMRELRRMMGDRRTEYRIDTRPQAMMPPKDGAERHDEGEEREKLRRSLENDDTGLPNFVQWS